MRLIFLVVFNVFLLFNVSAQSYTGVDSELFIEINEPGFFTINLNNQSITSNTGRFRFFDIDFDRADIAIESKGRLLVKQSIRINSGKRLLARYSLRKGLNIYNELALYNGQEYCLDNWGNSRYTNRPSHYQLSNSPLNQQEFSQLVSVIKNESFDDARQLVLTTALNHRPIFVQQVSELLRLFSFEDKKLDIAINLYPSVIDTQNFYLLRDEFSFINNKDKLNDFLLHAQPIHQRQLRLTSVTLNEFAALQNAIKREPFDDGKQTVLKLALQNKLLNVNQLSMILKMFSFEEKKLDIAIAVYPSVSDYQNFYLLRDSFTFQTNKDKFSRFLIEQAKI